MRHHNQFREVSESEIGRPHHRLANPVYTSLTVTDTTGNQVTGVFEVVKWKYWDIYQAAVHVVLAQQYLFVVGSGGAYTPVGGAQIQKSNLQCNLPGQGGVLVNPDYFLVKSMGQRLLSTIWPPDASILTDQVYVELQIGDKFNPYFQGICSDIPGGSALFISGSAPAAAAGQWAVNIGWPTTHNQITLASELPDQTGQPDLGVTISQGQNFRLDVDPTLFPGGPSQLAAAGDPGGVGLTTRFELIGALARSVQ